VAREQASREAAAWQWQLNRQTLNRPFSLLAGWQPLLGLAWKPQQMVTLQPAKSLLMKPKKGVGQVVVTALTAQLHGHLRG